MIHRASNNKSNTSKEVSTFKQYFWTDTLSKVAIICILLFFIVAICKPFLIGPYPIIFKDELGLHLGFCLSDYSIQGLQWKVDYLLSSTAYEIDMAAGGLMPPLSQGESGYHWLGTDIIGRDVLSGLCNGAAIAFKVGFFSTLISLIVGVILGSLAGYFGNSGFKMQWPSIIITIIFTMVGAYCSFYSIDIDFNTLVLPSALIIALVGLVAIYLIGRFSSFTQISIPVDAILLKVLEFFKAVPTLLLLLVLIAIIPDKSIWTIIAIISLFQWTKVARYARAEMLYVRSQDYITTVHSLGYSHWKVLFNHAIPNAFPPVLVIVAFGFSAAILMESMLSFLGIGLELQEVTWGSLLAEARRNMSAWWLAVFPGLAIFLIIASLNIIAERVNGIINPRINDRSID